MTCKLLQYSVTVRWQNKTKHRVSESNTRQRRRERETERDIESGRDHVEAEMWTKSRADSTDSMTHQHCHCSSVRSHALSTARCGRGSSLSETCWDPRRRHWTTTSWTLSREPTLYHDTAAGGRRQTHQTQHWRRPSATTSTSHSFYRMMPHSADCVV